MNSMTQLTHRRDDPNANAQRQRGNPRNSFPLIDSTDFYDIVVPPVNELNPSVEVRGAFVIDGYSPSTQPLIPDYACEKIKPKCTIAQFLQRNRAQYVGALRMAGIPNADAEDIVQDAITNLIGDVGTLLDSRFTRKEIAEQFKPKLKQYVTAAVESYYGQQSNVEEIEEPRVTKDLNIDDNPFYHAVWHRVWDESPNKKDHNHESKSLFSEDPLSFSVRNDESREKVFSWLAIEVYEAIKETKPNLPDLRKRYAFRANNHAYQSLAFERGNLDEQKIADYVAFGARNLTKEELLSQPLFYEVLYHVLRTAQFSDDFESLLQEEPTFAPIRSGRRKIKYGDNRNGEYGRLKAQLSGHLHGDTISDLLTDGNVKEKVGRTNLSRLRRSLPHHGGRKSDGKVSQKMMYGPAIGTLAIKLESEFGLPSDVARKHALEMPNLLRTY